MGAYKRESQILKSQKRYRGKVLGLYWEKKESNSYREERERETETETEIDPTWQAPFHLPFMSGRRNKEEKLGG